jgi:hypothetical protein
MRNNQPDRQFIVILADGVEKAVACTDDQLKSRVEEIVRRSGIVTPRANPQSITVMVVESKVEDEKIVRKPWTKFVLQPPLTRMTENEFNAEQNALLEQLPKAFMDIFKTRAWDDGHSSGLEAVVESLRCSIDEFLPSIKQFEEDLKLSIMNHGEGLVPKKGPFGSPVRGRRG